MKYKIAVSLNRIDPLFLTDFEKARAYHFSHGVDITFTFKNIDVHGYTSVWSGSRWLLQGSQNLVTLDLTADVNMFVFDMGEWATPAGSPFPLLPNTPTGSCGTNITTNNKPFINIGTHITDHNSGQTAIAIAHEILHSVVQTANLKGFKINDVLDSYYHNEDWNFPGGNFAQDWVLLKPFLNSVSNYQYFSPIEVAKWKLKPELFALLDKIRGECGFPFIITSGLRSVAENNALQGSVEDSAHLVGLACDLSITLSEKRFKLVSVALKNGITRIGIGKNFVHLDIDKSKAQNCLWHYY